MIIIGIDCGLTGAFAALQDGRLVALHDLPTIANGTAAKVKRQIDPAGLAEIIRELRADFPGERFHAVVEKPGAMPGQGSASTFSLGDSLGCIRGVLAAKNLPTEFVSPASWKKSIGVPADKEQVRARAIQLFPGASLHRKADHNRAEAILLALFGHRKLA